MAPVQLTSRVIVETEHYGSNNSLVIGDDGVAMIDAPHCLTDAFSWASYAQQLGPIRFLINTDHHPDHTIGNYAIGNPPISAEIVAHRITRERLLTEAPSLEYLRDLMSRLDPASVPLFDDYQVKVPNVVFDSTMEVHMKGVSLQLRHQPGHTRNSVLIWMPEDRVLFTGDIVCEAGLPSFQDSTVADWFDALDVVEEYDFEFIVPGHGQVTDRAGVERYRQLGRAVVQEVSQRINAGHEQSQVLAEVRFDDNIHVPTPTCAGYPEDLIESFQVRSLERIYQDLLEAPSLAQR